MASVPAASSLVDGNAVSASPSPIPQQPAEVTSGDDPTLRLKRTRVSKAMLTMLNHALESSLGETARECQDTEQAQELRNQSKALAKARIEIAKGQMNDHDVRMERDIQAGHTIAAARKKLKSRLRAERCRFSGQAQRAGERIERDRAWHDEFVDAKPEWIRWDAGEFEGDDPERSPDLHRAPLPRRAFTAHRDEGEDGIFPCDRTWTKRGNMTQQQKANKRKREVERQRRNGTYVSRNWRRLVANTAKPKSAAIKPPAVIDLDSDKDPAEHRAELIARFGVIPPWREHLTQMVKDELLKDEPICEKEEDKDYRT
eukprot:4808591-Amphidinium_carterae.1